MEKRKIAERQKQLLSSELTPQNLLQKITWYSRYHSSRVEAGDTNQGQDRVHLQGLYHFKGIILPSTRPILVGKWGEWETGSVADNLAVINPHVAELRSWENIHPQTWKSPKSFYDQKDKMERRELNETSLFLFHLFAYLFQVKSRLPANYQTKSILVSYF